MYNHVVMVGNLTRDIERKNLPSGGIVAKTAIATSYKYKSATGEQKEEVCFLEVNIFGVYAEIASKYLRKGSKVLLEGRLIFEQWNAQDGSPKSRHSLRVTELKMLDSKPQNVQPNQNNQNEYRQSEENFNNYEYEEYPNYGG